MTPTRTTDARALALEAALAQLDTVAGTPLGGVPGTAMSVVDPELRIRSMFGPGWSDLGVDVDDVVGRLLSEVSEPHVFERVREEYERVLAGEARAFSVPVLGRRRTLWIAANPIRDADGAVVGIMAISWDQTDARQAEELYRVIADNATDVVTRHDVAGRYLYVSPSIEAYLGWRPEDLMGRSCFEFLHPDDVDPVTAALASALPEGRLVTVEMRFRRPDGSYVWIESTSRAVPSVDGTGIAEFQCSSRDITARRETEAELARRLAQQSVVVRLGERALQRRDVDELQQEACRLVAETLDVELVYSLEHLTGPRMRVRAGVGWPDGMIGGEIEVRSFDSERPGDHYADGAVVIDDLPNDRSLRARPLRANGVISGATVLIGDRGHPLGLLGAYSRSRRTFRPEDVDFLHAVAHVLAGALERTHAEERIRHDALHDALTGLPNRTLLLDRLQIALARAERDGSRVAVLFLDLDRLKVLNDSLGHHAGDDLLRAVGPRLAEVVRPSDTVARFGGDEFAVILQDIDDERAALAVAARIVRAFERPFLVGGEPRFGSASVGVVVTDPAVPRSAAELLSDADAAMYRAKDRGRGGYELFDAGLRASITERLCLEEDLRRALEQEDGLWVAYQPYWALPECRLAGVEALVRWDHAQRGPIAPAEFIPVAEDSGLIVDLGARVLREACRQIAWLRAETPAGDLQLTVNVSARQFAEPAIIGVVADALAASGLPATALGLEITERLLLEESPATVHTISALQELGVRLILDDFGTGYSSLRYLQRYPLDGLKVDRSFVAGLGADGEGDGAIVEAIVGMARALGMRVVPEGVETAGQLARLVRLGCDFAQGFHLARPLTAGDLERRLRTLSSE